MDMPDNLDDMTMKEVKDWVAKEQKAIDFKREAVQKLCWDEIGEVCKKYNCMIKPVVKLNEAEDGLCTFYADLVVIAMETETDDKPSGKSDDKEPNGDGDKSDDKESNKEAGSTREEQGHESPSNENDKV